MVQIKVFEFEISNASSAPTQGDLGEPWYSREQKKIASPEQIEEEINRFIDMCGAEVIDIKTNICEVRYHNNGRGNTNKIIYTIIYR